MFQISWFVSIFCSFNDLVLNGTTFNSNAIPPERLTEEGNISQSGNFITQGHITSSGNISSSGFISSSGIRSNGQVNINSSFGQLRLSDDNFSDFISLGQSGTVGYIKTSDADNKFKFRRGSDNTDVLSIDFGNEEITASGDFLVEGDAIVAEYIYHKGDNDTYLRFAPNLVNLVAGGKSAIKYDASTGKIIVNNTNENVDFQRLFETRKIQ